MSRYQSANNDYLLEIIFDETQRTELLFHFLFIRQRIGRLNIQTLFIAVTYEIHF